MRYFQQALLLQFDLVFMFVYSLEKKNRKFQLKPVFTIFLFKKITVSAKLFITRYGCGVMVVHNLIKVEIKQTKMNFFCLLFNPVFSRNSLTTHVLQKYVLEKLNMYIVLG